MRREKEITLKILVLHDLTHCKREDFSKDTLIFMGAEAQKIKKLLKNDDKLKKKCKTTA